MRPPQVWTEVDAWADPERVFLELYAHQPECVWLDTASAYRGRAGFSYLCVPDQTLTAWTTQECETLLRTLDASIANETETAFARNPDAKPNEGLSPTRNIPAWNETFGLVASDTREGNCPAGHSARELPAPAFHLGWVGWIGYEFPGRRPKSSTPASGASRGDGAAREGEWPESGARGGEPFAASTQWRRYPLATFGLVTRAIVFDHAQKRIFLVSQAGSSCGDWIAEMRRHLIALESNASERPNAAPMRGMPRWRHSDEEYLRMIAECQDAIRRGDAYQLCLTNTVSVDGPIDAVASYTALRQASPSHHGAFLRLGGVSLLSSSPEQFLTINTAGVVKTRPIKGTRPRGTSANEDTVLRRELASDEKERAENTMIVDLMRNDFSRFATVGSVCVDELCLVESYPHVHQLVSTVTGHAPPSVALSDVLGACFPAGSMTGAPKESAMAILARLEKGERGVYSGAFGFVGMTGEVDLAMSIRTIVVDERGASIGTGGGITALSQPASELAEMKLKARALLESLRFDQ